MEEIILTKKQVRTMLGVGVRRLDSYDIPFRKIEQNGVQSGAVIGAYDFMYWLCSFIKQKELDNKLVEVQLEEIKNTIKDKI